jgi:hypothetical protein
MTRMVQPKPRRPALQPAFEHRVGDLDPAERTVLAHQTAALVVRAGRERGADEAPVADDGTLTDRLVGLADDMGLNAMADLWRHSAPDTLPGTLWSLYLLRAWVRGQGAEAARLFALGNGYAEVSGAVAGVAEPLGPREMARLGDAVLTSAFEGDFAVALERAAAFCRVVSAGRLDEADAADDAGDDENAGQQTRLASGNVRMAEQLEQCARLWRSGRLA